MPATPEAPSPETILAFDFGLRRIGVAVGQTVTGSASPLGVVANADSGPDWRQLERLIRDWRPTRLVVGMPRHADGSVSAIGPRVEDFCAALRRFSLPVETVDERHSSSEAQRVLVDQRKAGTRRRIRRETIDAAAATLLAQRWLQHER